MASNFIQSGQLSRIPGSAGQQSVVQDRSPLVGDAINNLTSAAVNAYDTAGTIYAKNTAQSLVNEELENVDSAISLAEKSAADENFVQPDEMPVSKDEFALIESAVRSGKMSREKARLLSSSRLRTRISEQPFFADKLRQAASNVIGFNIQSESAKQYFASLPTDAQLSGGGQTQQQKWWDEASAIGAVMPGVPVEEIYQQIAMESYAETQKNLLENQQAAGAISSQTRFSEINRLNSDIDMGSVLGSAKAIFEREGSVKEQEFSQIITQVKNTRLAEVDQIFTDHTSTEYQRARQAVEDRFTGISEFVDSVGFDTLNELGIERAKRARTMLGDKLFFTEKLISENMGSDVFSQAMEMFTNITNPAQLEVLLRSMPTVGKIGAILGNEVATNRFGNQVREVYEKFATGQEIGADLDPMTGVSEEEVADLVLREMFAKGGEAESESLRIMKEMGMETKPVSAVVQKAPGRATEKSREYFKVMYETALPEKTTQLGNLLAANPDLQWSIADNGAIQLVEPEPVVSGTGGRSMREDIRATQRAQQVYDQANDLVEHINLYAEGIDKGWGTEVKRNKQMHRDYVSQNLDTGWLNQAQTISNNARDLIFEGNFAEAERTYSDLKRIDPRWDNISFREFRAAMDRLRREAELPEEQ